MRTEKEMFNLILNTANADERIKAVVMVGSRANPDCPKDIYQDYDIAYYVDNVGPFYNNLEWIEEKFGKPSVMQLPELGTHPLLPPENDGHFTYLMIFSDGNRIDLTIKGYPYVNNGEPAVILLDKKGDLNDIKINPSFFHIQRPSSEVYHCTCNEFWWCLNNVAKGIARDELPYVMEMFSHYVRDMLNQMVDWYIGIKNDFTVSAGKMGKFYKKYLPANLYEMYTHTYSDSDYNNIWASVFTACELFRLLASEVAIFFDYTYNNEEDENMMKYIYFVKDNVDKKIFESFRSDEITIVEIKDNDTKSVYTREVLKKLPEWFGNEQALDEYADTVKELPYWAALNKENRYIGFLSVKIHYGHTGDIYVCGVIPGYQRRGIGKSLYNSAEAYLIQNGCKYIIVKTLSDMVNYKPYAMTREFYKKVGFEPLVTLTEMWDDENPCLIMIKSLI